MFGKSIETRLEACLDRVKIPFVFDQVYKDECVFSFNTPLSKGGLYLSLKTLYGYGEDFVGEVYRRSDDLFPLFLHIEWNKVSLPDDEREKLSKPPEKLAIGIEGGFQVDEEKFSIEKSHALVLFPDRVRIPLPCDGLPWKLQEAITKIQEHDSVTQQQKTAAWQDEDRQISQYAKHLKQLPADKTISMDPAEWICEESGLRENLWLNLSSGYIGSGRKVWGGVGGTGAALRHYEEQLKRGNDFPLAVKLGTINAAGADVYSYAPDEDNMVIDPYLEQHLRHWGIEMTQSEKTAKTTSEIEMAMNSSFEFNKITEASKELVPVAGKCHIGLKNLGNSCYMNAVLQLIWVVPEVRKRYLDNGDLIFQVSEEPGRDFHVQMAKIGFALIDGETGQIPEEGTDDVDTDIWSVKPLSFKTLVGHGHPDFSSSHQQDAAEYFIHLLTVMDAAERAEVGFMRKRALNNAPEMTSSVFSYLIEERVECAVSHRVSYNTAVGSVLQLGIPVELATNKDDVERYNDRQLKRQKLQESGVDVEIMMETAENGEQEVREVKKDDKEEKVLPKVPFAACLSQFTGDVEVGDYYSRYLRKKTTAVKNTKFKTFPPFLLVQMQRYYHDETWQPAKLEVLVEAPNQLHLEYLRGMGKQPGEELQPESADGADDEPPDVDRGLLEQLTAMGFSENGCIRALTTVSNATVDTAMEWILTHMEDPDFNDPLPKSGDGRKVVSETKVQSLMNMGFEERAARASLIEKKGDEGEAVDWLLSNIADLKWKVKEVLEKKDVMPDSDPTKFRDGKGNYELVGFISHMGSSTACGHYVCHIKKNDRWILFNDEKVAVSASPPLDLGYLYMYRRLDVEGVVE